MNGAAAPRIAALLCCHNRRTQTLAALEALQASAAASALALELVVLDDGSSDGTAEAVIAAWPQAHLLRGDGSLFWCRGMHRALAHALTLPGISHFLWLNDDTLLQRDALQRLLHQLAGQGDVPAIAVGATHDSAGRCSYGGGRSLGGFRALRYTRVGGGAVAERCDVFNGNCVLLPRAVVERVGNLDPVFEHAMGDTDYALRAGRAGVAIWVVPGFVGRCETNPTAGSAADAALSGRQRFRALLSRKGLPWRSWLHFTRRHGGVLWPLRFVWPYLKVWWRPSA